MSSNIENSKRLELDFTKLSSMSDQVIVAVAQDIETQEVLIIGYANKQALEHTIKHKVATFWSTSRNELWIKGKSSGDYLDIVSIKVNCEQNSVLYLVKLRGNGACHTQTKEGVSRLSCFYRSIHLVQPDKLEFLDE